MTKTNGKVRYAVVGLGYIAQTAALPAFKHAKNCELVALISSDELKLKKLSKKYKVDFTGDYPNYEAILKEAAVDAVYIALPNTLHYEFTMRALRGGCHVLCEKPFATTVEECAEMGQTADDLKLKLMVAYRLHFDPANLEAIKIVQNNKIGDIKFFNSVFSMQVRDRNNIRLKEELGGGPVYDLGIYAINAARYIMKAEPTEVCAFISEGKDSRFSEVEESMTAIMKFPGERLAHFSTSFGAADVGYYQVIGTKGDLCVDPAYEYAKPLKHYLTVNDKTKIRVFKKTDQFAPELTYFADCILNNKQVEPSAFEGLSDIKIINALHESARSGLSVRVDIESHAKRPTNRQKYVIPPVKQPSLIHAKSPSR